MMQSRKHCLALSAQARSPLQPLLPRKPKNDRIRCAMLSVAIWKRRAMPQTGLSGNTMPPDSASKGFHHGINSDEVIQYTQLGKSEVFEEIP